MRCCCWVIGSPDPYGKQIDGMGMGDLEHQQER